MDYGPAGKSEAELRLGSHYEPEELSLPTFYSYLLSINPVSGMVPSPGVGEQIKQRLCPPDTQPKRKS